MTHTETKLWRFSYWCMRRAVRDYATRDPIHLPMAMVALVYLKDRAAGYADYDAASEIWSYCCSKQASYAEHPEHERVMFEMIGRAGGCDPMAVSSGLIFKSCIYRGALADRGKSLDRRIEAIERERDKAYRMLDAIMSA